MLIVQRIIQNHQNIAIPSPSEVAYKKPSSKQPVNELSVAIHWRSEFKSMLKKNKFHELIQKSSALNARQCFQNLLYMLSIYVYKCDRKFLDLNGSNAEKFIKRRDKIINIQKAIIEYLDEVHGKMKTKQFS